MTARQNFATEDGLAQALSLHQSGAVEKAAAVYRQLLAVRGDDPQLLFLFGTAQLQLGNPAACIELLEKVLTLVPDPTGALVNLGLAHQQLGDGEKALACFAQAIAARSDYAEAYFCRANLLSALGRPADALADYARAAALKPDYAQCHYNHASALTALGRQDQAIAAYDRAIAAAPAYAAAYNNRAVLLRGLKRLPQALADCDRAVALQPTYAEALVNRGTVLRDMNRLAEALAAYDAALAAVPDYALAHCCRGDALKELGRLADAFRAYDRAIALRPDYADAYVNRGNVHMQCKQYAAALTDYDRALSYAPNLPAVSNNRGNALWKLKRLDEAEACFARAIALKPDFAESHNNRACVLKDMALYYQDGQLVAREDEAVRSNVKRNRALLEAALSSCDSALAFRPDYAEAYLNRGHVLVDLNRRAEALQAYDLALEAKPDFAEAYCGRANVLTDTNRWDEALASYDRAIAFKPDYAEAYNNRGNLQKLMRDFAAARSSFRQALVLEADNASMQWNLALLELAAGNFKDGWALYESRWRRDVFAKARRDFSQPLWTGAEDIRGKRILIHAEQGFGDTVQFCRYAPLVAARGAVVIFEAPAPLLPLLQSLSGDIVLVRRGDALPAFDLHCPTMSLPRAFATEVATIPADVPYLSADPSRVAAWQARLGEKLRPRIGLVVSGKPEHANDRNRSIALSAFGAILALPMDFHLVQREIRAADEAPLAAATNLYDHRSALTDYGETAALVACLDGVISVDTSVAHVAGALGVPLHLLLPYAVDWRWFLDGETSPWYPAARLYRQPMQGDWKFPLARLMDILVRRGDDAGI